MADFNFTSTADIAHDISSGIFHGNRQFRSQPNIIHEISSNLNRPLEFVSQADIESVTTDPVFNRYWSFASQADIPIGLDFQNPIIRARREFASTADAVTFNTVSDVDLSHYFLTQPIIRFDTISDIRAEKLFTSTAAIVHSLSAPAWLKGGSFAVSAGFSSNIRSDIKGENCFVSQSDISSDLASDILAEMMFTSAAGIVSDIASDISQTKELSVTAGITFDTSSSFTKSNLLTSQADIVADIVADIQMERQFSSQADVAYNTISDAKVEWRFVTQADIVHSISSDLNRPLEFVSQADIGTAINNLTHQVERQPATTANIVHAISSDADADRSFASAATITHSISSDADAEREFATAADIVSDISDPEFYTEREFAITSNIVFATAASMKVDALLTSAPTITHNTPTVNIFKTNEFGSIPTITTNSVSAITNERRFSVQSDIEFNISELIRIYTTRSFASTVNIIIEVESLNIWNMSIDDLFPTKMKSLTHDQQTATWRQI